MLKARSGQPKHLSLDYKGGMKSGVYQIRNIANGKCYVGSAKRIASRWRDHKKGMIEKTHSRKLQNALNKYGDENFEFHILEYCLPEHMIEREQYWIDFLDSYRNGYNSRKNAKNNLGLKHSIEARKKMSGVHKGKITSAETRLKISKAKKGKTAKPHSMETRQKMSVSQKLRQQRLREMLIASRS